MKDSTKKPQSSIDHLDYKYDMSPIEDALAEGLKDFRSGIYLRPSSIVISYSRQDAGIIGQLYNHLAKIFGHEIWYDNSLYGGQGWWSEILKQISDCDTLIYLLSREAFESVYCRFEFTEAWRYGKRLLPVQVRKWSFHKVISDLQIIYLTDNASITVDGIVDLIASLNKPKPDILQVSPNSLWDRRSTSTLGEGRKGIQVKVDVLAEIEPTWENRLLCNTGILLLPGDKIRVRASGELAIDTGGYKIIDADGTFAHVGKPLKATPQAYVAKESSQGDLGIPGTLIGWVDKTGEEMGEKFYIGSKKEWTVEDGQSGFLHLAINDEKNKYGNNSGEFKATIEIWR